MARTARTWKGARTPSSLKRVRQSLRRRAVNRRTRSEAKTLVQSASEIALGRSEGEGPEAVEAAISALDRAASKGIVHPNNAARRKSRLMSKVNAAHLLDGAQATVATAAKKKTTASKTTQRKKVTAAKASKAAAGKATDRPRTAAGKAKVAVTRASRESAAARRRAKSDDAPESS
ncbi:MAG: 30S ribosomal protein S20 [Candidatus Limnocylindria bacterium]